MRPLSRLSQTLIVVAAALAIECGGAAVVMPPTPDPKATGEACWLADATRETLHPDYPPVIGLPQSPGLRVVVISDLNGSYGSTEYRDEVHAAVDRILALRPDLVLATGDLVAGQKADVDHPAMWEAFHAAVTDRLADAGIPLAVTPGNHDASGYPAFVGERDEFVVQWMGRWPAVRFVDPSRYPLRYTFTAGPAYFISLDATTLGPLSDDQMRWLDARLHEARNWPVKIIFGHVPLYAFTHNREREVIGDPALEALLKRHKAAIYLSGHHHAWYPGKRGDLRLASMGCLGTGPRTLIGDSQPSARSITVLDVTADGIERLEALSGTTFERIIPRETLPAIVGLPETPILRDDID